MKMIEKKVLFKKKKNTFCDCEYFCVYSNLLVGIRFQALHVKGGLGRINNHVVHVSLQFGV